jgi:hypothetical protein
MAFSKSVIEGAEDMSSFLSVIGSAPAAGAGVAEDFGKELVELHSGEPAGLSAADFPVLKRASVDSPLDCGGGLGELEFATSSLEALGELGFVGAFSVGHGVGLELRRGADVILFRDVDCIGLVVINGLCDR